MLTPENQFFVRLFVLILKGGTLVLRQTFVKKLADRGSQLEDFIKANKEEIKRLKKIKVLTLKQYNMLFPNGDKTIDICKWDISLLSCLLLNIFDVSMQKEINAIENIRKFRNEFVAHNPNGTVESYNFDQQWNHLKTSIKNLADGLSHKEQSEVVEVIRAAKEDDLDTKHIIQQIKDMDEMNQDLEHISQTLEQLSLNVQESRTFQEGTQADISYIKGQLDQCVRKDNQDISTVIVGGIKISGDDPEAVTRAAAILIADAKKSKENCSEQGAMNTVFSVFTRVKNVCCKSDISTDGEECVTAFVQDIRNAGGEVINVTEGSVLLHIKCHSVTGVLTVLKYFQSVKIKQRLDKIAAYLNEQIGFQVSLEACIQLQSLRGALHLIQEKQKQKQEFTKSVHFVMKCRNAEGVTNVTNIFNGQDASANMSALSEDLSNKVGSQVILKAFIKTDISQAGKHAFGACNLEQEPTGQCVHGLESHEEQERNGSQSNELTGAKPWTSLTQYYDNAISLLRLGEHQYAFVAFLVYSDKDKPVSDLVKDELGRALHNLTGIDRDLICTARKYNPPGSYILYEFLRCLKRSSTVIVIESECLGESHYAMLKDAQKFGKQIVPITFEKDEPYLKVFTNDLRLVLKKENEKYTLNMTWMEVAISIMKLIASEIDVKAKEISSRRSKARTLSGIMKIADAIPVSSISDETLPLKENAELETGDCPVQLTADIFKEMLPSLRKRRSKEENEEEDNVFLSDLANKSWDDCDKRVRSNTCASQGYEQARRQENGLASRAYSRPDLALFDGPFKLYNVYNYARLKVSNFDLPQDVDRDQLEKYLAKEEFEDIFEITFEEFIELPEWKRNDLKRKADLY